MDEPEHLTVSSAMIVAMDDWTDLDQAYLDIFGHHPDLDDQER